LPAKKFRKKKRRNVPRIYFDIFNQQEHAKGYIKTLFQEVLSQLTSTRKTNPTPNLCHATLACSGLKPGVLG
jgi:predicted nucleotidyltransferase component of viral defense system